MEKAIDSADIILVENLVLDIGQIEREYILESILFDNFSWNGVLLNLFSCLSARKRKSDFHCRSEGLVHLNNSQNMH